ncbi:MAG: penicillin-binding protein activator LpoB [Acidobacteria bacterium]|nr:penicillin-binding protein activator LpoB [Acidobacteriota bacterium]
MTPRHRLAVALWAGLLFLGAVAVPGCAARRPADVTFHDPNMDFSLVQRAAVLPFANLTTNQAAGERVRDVFMTMLQATGSVYVLPPGEVARGLGRARVANPAQPTPEEVTSLAKELGANAVIAGTVREYGEVRSGNASGNVIALSLQMFEADSGRLIWSASSSKGGITAKDRMLGTGGEPMNDVTEQAVHDLLDKLFE